MHAVSQDSRGSQGEAVTMQAHMRLAQVGKPAPSQPEPEPPCLCGAYDHEDGACFEEDTADLVPDVAGDVAAYRKARRENEE